MSQPNNVTIFPSANQGQARIENLCDLPRNRVYLIQIDKADATEVFQYMHVERRLLLLEGCVVVSTTSGEERMLVGDSLILPVGQRHRIVNVGKITAAVLDIRSGSYLDEQGGGTPATG